MSDIIEVGIMWFLVLILSPPVFLLLRERIRDMKEERRLDRKAYTERVRELAELIMKSERNRNER